MTPTPFPSKTLSLDDLRRPEIARVRRELRRFALRLGIAGTPFAVNGILRRRLWVRAHKMWEYARGVACVLAAAPQQGGDYSPARVLDFGGGATLPVFFLADRGCNVLSLDIDTALTDFTNRVARERGWLLRGSTVDITATAMAAGGQASNELGEFDAVISFSVLEHIPKHLQAVAVERLAQRLKPGGVFALTFDYGEDAPVEGAVRSEEEVARLVAATGLEFLDGAGFTDTGERFALDKRHAQRKFTFASLFLKKGREK